MFRWLPVAFAAAALVAPGAQAMALSDDGGVSAGKAEIAGGNGVSAQVATGGGNGVSAQVVTSGGNGSSAQPAGESRNGFSWASALLAGSALAALGAAGAALARRPQRRPATLTI